ncbi:MAG: beta-propeller fold lactonase family protein [Opitutaceae bacterium]
MFSRKLTHAMAAVAALLFAAGVASASNGAGHNGPGSVYTMSNAADGNRILVFDRLPSGKLKPVDDFPTGGFGTGGGLGNQGGLILQGNWLLAVNAGSSEVSLFKVNGDGLILRDIVPSGGETPLSIAIDDEIVYVLNAGGGADSITGFVLDQEDGRLIPIPGSSRALSAASVGPAQVSFNRRGNVLIVSEKGTDRLTTFTVDHSGLASVAIPQASNGQTPFGFAFDRWGRLIVSEAAGGAPGASTVSSYAVGPDGMLTTLTSALATTQTAACWIAVDKLGRFAYATNTGSSTITGLQIRRDGTLRLLESDGVTASTGKGSMPIDMATTRDGRFVYALSGGTNAITGYRVGRDGSLTPVEDGVGVPAGSNGLAAR